jgi:hypothetical protein
MLQWHDAIMNTARLPAIPASVHIELVLSALWPGLYRPPQLFLHPPSPGAGRVGRAVARRSLATIPIRDSKRAQRKSRLSTPRPA